MYRSQQTCHTLKLVCISLLPLHYTSIFKFFYITTFIEYQENQILPSPVSIFILCVLIVINISKSNSVFACWIEILSGSAVAVGAVTSEFPLEKLPGWETGSIGYHSDSGG